MKTLIAILFILITPVVAFADWNAAAKKVRNSVVFIETSQSSCTGIVIHEKNNFVLTAAHCYDDPKQMIANGKPITKIIAWETKKDLLVIQVDGLDLPAIALAKDNPKLGDEVASYGFGYGLEQPLFKTHHVAADDLRIDYENIGGPLIAVDTTYVPGVSGGPLLNQLGEVVAVVQLGTPHVGFGVGAETIRDKVGRYFELK